MIPSGTIIDGRYEIIGLLGAGGMGQVYRAARPLLGDEVAIKVVNAPLNEASEARQRFLRESRASAQLRHPNIVSILDFNIDTQGQPYLVMELLSGPSLRDELELSGPLSPAAAAAILTPLAAALQMAHDRGITHRDLKPANIVAHRYDSGERVYKIIDFGLAAVKEAEDETRLTEPGHFLGTLAYAAPEQLRGETADARTDVYALGGITYEMLTGQRPFDTENRVTLINDALTARPVEPGKHRPDLPPELDAVIMRALAKNRSERWQSAMEFVRALQAVANTVPAKPVVLPEDHLLSRYDLGELVGRGRLGSVVYHGTHRALAVPVAIRVLRRDEQPHWEAVKARFLLEARTLQVSHPNLLQVRDYGEDERRVFVVTDYIDGPSLRQEIARERMMAWGRARGLLRQMADATAALNDHGGYVAGVNPDMIRLSQDRIVLSTAGIQSVQDVLATMREQQLRGIEANEQELPYIAPEVLLGSGPDAASDVFTLGVLTYQMVTGALPFRALTLPELIGQMLQAAPADARSLNPDVPESASALLGQCLVPEVKQRIPSARTLLDRL